MTVPTTSIVAGPYVGNGAADTFDYNWKIWDASELTVYREDATGAVATLVEGTDYVVNGVGEDLGRSITLNAPLQVGQKLTIHSNFQPTQETDFVSQGTFYPQVHEDAFDKLTYLIQQLKDALGRALHIPEYVAGVDTSLPVPVGGSVIGWNSDGSAVVNLDPTGATVVTIGPTAPPDPSATPLWYDTSNNDLRFWDGVQWTSVVGRNVWDFTSTPSALPLQDVIFSVAHGLNTRPVRAEARAVCRVSNLGYSPGDEVLIASSIESFSFVDTYTAYRTLWVDDTHVGFSYHGALYVAHKLVPGSVGNIDGNNWDIVLRAAV